MMFAWSHYSDLPDVLREVCDCDCSICTGWFQYVEWWDPIEGAS